MTGGYIFNVGVFMLFVLLNVYYFCLIGFYLFAFYFFELLVCEFDQFQLGFG
jgi:hypothetical protein